MSVASKHWILKVVSGPHQGAEILLSEGKSLVGSDEECDVVLQDLLMAPQHFTLDLNPDGIRISPLGGRLYCNGVRMKHAENKIEPFSFITAGGTHLLIGPSDEQWPNLSLSDIPEIEKEEEKSASPEADSNETEEALIDDVAEKEEEGEQDAEDAKDAEDAEDAKEAEEPSARKRRAFFGIGLGILLLLVWLVLMKNMGGIGGGGDSTQKGEVTTATSGSPDEKLAMVTKHLQDHDYGGDLVASRSGQIIEVTGYVPTDEKLNLLREALSKEFDAVFSRARSVEMIEASANAMLKNLGLDLLAEVREEGTLEVSGVIPPEDEDNWKTAVGQLSAIPGVGPEKLVSSVSIAQAALPEGEDAGPGEEDPGEFSISGSNGGQGTSSANPSESPAAATNDTATLVEIIGTRSDGINWIRMKNGDVLFKGARIPTGGIVEEITADTVTIREADGRRVVKTGESAWEAGEGAP